MDFDPDSPLNRAHSRERQGEDHVKAERFDSAIQSFNQAIGHLRDVLKLTGNAKALEAIQSQISRIEGQIRSTHQKKALLIQRLQDQQNRKQSAVTKVPAARMSSAEKADDAHDLGLRIVRVMDEHDSLLQVLMRRGNEDTADGNRSASGSTSNTLTGSTTSSTASYRIANKQPKGDATVIEELRGSNEQLRILVEQLVTELSAVRLENQRLKQQVSDLQAEQQDHNSLSSGHLLPHLPPLEPPTLLY